MFFKPLSSIFLLDICLIFKNEISSMLNLCISDFLLEKKVFSSSGVFERMVPTAAIMATYNGVRSGDIADCVCEVIKIDVKIGLMSEKFILKKLPTFRMFIME